MSDQPTPIRPNGATDPMLPTLRTVLDKTTGSAYVLFSIGDPESPNSIRMQIEPKAGCELALNLLSACYAAIGEQAAFEYATQNRLVPSELINLMRNHTNSKFNVE